MESFKKIKSIVVLISVIAAVGCINKQSNVCQEPEFILPDKIVHEVDADPVKITNIFPQHGLTDPHTMIVGDRLYIGLGHDQSWDIETTWTMDRWEIWSTSDLKTWVKETEILPNDTYFGPEANCWAGDFAQKDGKYYWYFSNRHYNTGVMVADKPGGPYRDALGKPLITEGLAPTRSYDPEVFEEDGVYTIFWGAGTYYAATLGDDMISLKDEPQKIEVFNPDGSPRSTDDKSTTFKRDGHYYLVWGAHYAMSDKLRGPYEYKGRFYSGGHGSIFNWKGQWYVVHEFHDISMFYRGVMLKPMCFHPDGTVDLKSDFVVPEGGGRIWDFDNSVLGWRSPSGTTIQWTDGGMIKGEITGKRAIIESANWSMTGIKGKELKIRVRNQTNASQLKFSFAKIKNDVPQFWRYPEVNWFDEAYAIIDVSGNSSGFVEYSLELDKVENIPPSLRRLRIEFLGADSGNWEIDDIRIQ